MTETRKQAQGILQPFTTGYVTLLGQGALLKSLRNISMLRNSLTAWSVMSTAALMYYRQIGSSSVGRGMLIPGTFRIIGWDWTG